MGMFDQVKQGLQMRKEAKKIQAEIERITYTYQNGGITCTVKGDLEVTAVKITPEALKEVAAGKTDRFETMLQNVINGALKGVKAETQAMMQKMMKDGKNPMAGLMGGGQ